MVWVMALIFTNQAKLSTRSRVAKATWAIDHHLTDENVELQGVQQVHKSSIWGRHQSHDSQVLLNWIPKRRPRPIFMCIVRHGRWWSCLWETIAIGEDSTNSSYDKKTYETTHNSITMREIPKDPWLLMRRQRSRSLAKDPRT